MRNSRIFSLLLLTLSLLSAGCESLTGPDDPKAPPPPEVIYKGLTGQKCTVMVWADSRTRLEFDSLQLDLSKRMVALLDNIAAVKDSNKDSKDKDPNAPLPQSSFLYPASVARFQRDHPEVYFQPIADIIPKLGVTRFIYIEIQEFSTQSPVTLVLLKGRAKATLTIYEVVGNQVTIALQERNIAVAYPRDDKAPEGIVPTDQVNANTIFIKTMDVLAIELGRRFVAAEK